MHMAVLTGNFHCVLLLLEEGATIPASDPFRLTPLLLAKLRLDNLRQAQPTSALLSKLNNDTTTFDKDMGLKSQDMSETAKAEYEGLLSITKVLVKHLAHKHMTTIGISLKTLSSPSPSPEHNNDNNSNHRHGLSNSLFSNDQHDEQLNDAITSLSNQLSSLEMKESATHHSDTVQIRENLNNLIDKIRKLGIHEKQ
ncbi:unnamed protein product [Absidia cylindrospora]